MFSQAQNNHRMDTTQIKRNLDSTLFDEQMALVSDAFRAVLMIAVSAIYSNPTARKLFKKYLTQAPDDPIIVIMLAFAVFCLLKCVSRIPLQLTLLSDSSIIFEDAFGVSMKVPFLQCQHLEIFHGFLEVYFKARPGLRHILRKQYQLVLAGGREGPVDGEAWPRMGKPRCKIVLQMIIVAGLTCAKCRGGIVENFSMKWKW